MFSITPIETAEGGAIPWRWKKRTFKASRATDPGNTRLINVTANCSRTGGP